MFPRLNRFPGFHAWWLWLALCAPAPSVLATDADLPAPVRHALAGAGIPESHIGIVVRDLDSGASLLSHGEVRSFNPASAMKLVTTLVGLDQLGPTHTWKTRVWVAGEVRDGVLEGDLILEGGGDPSLSQERFWSLLRQVREKGVREIRGDVLIDNGFYAIEPVDPAHFDNAPLKPYNAAPTALLVNHNVLPLRLAPEGSALSARLDPPALPLDNLATLDPVAGCDEGPDLDLRRTGDVLALSGAYPESCGERTVYLNLMCPPATVATLFNALWHELGGRHTGQVRLGERAPEARLWLEFDSPPLASIARDINTYSNNVMAKMLFLNLGAARFGGNATWDKGERAVREGLRERGLVMPELVLENGSGLSRIERISAASLAGLLDWAARQPIYYDFAASLPALGLEGTLKRRLAGSDLVGRAWLKTGSLNGARALAGYVLDRQGRHRILVFLVNHAHARQVAPAQEALLRWVMDMPPAAPTTGGTQVETPQR
jgi:D-alanyl-D-alanine carboxypeptidase/D-alanyl-D-alanine-endopeptidase (penicillin-binding protein 4)